MNNYIIGAGGLGREVAAMLLNAGIRMSDLAFIDDGVVKGTKVNNLPVWGGLNDLSRDLGLIHVYLALGNPQIRKKVLGQLAEMKDLQVNFPNLIHPSVIMEQPEFILVGQGNIVSQGVILTTNIELGSFNIINRAVTISHDTQIGDCTTLMPGVHISGGAHIGNEVFINSGSIIATFQEIADGTRIPSGSNS